MCGKTFELVMQRQTWGEDQVYYEDEVGRLRAMPRAWTSLADPDLFQMVAAGRSLFRVVDLLELAACIRKWQGGCVK
jgi:hypothetical protein